MSSRLTDTASRRRLLVLSQRSSIVFVLLVRTSSFFFPLRRRLAVEVVGAHAIAHRPPVHCDRSYWLKCRAGVDLDVRGDLWAGGGGARASAEQERRRGGCCWGKRAAARLPLGGVPRRAKRSPSGPRLCVGTHTACVYVPPRPKTGLDAVVSHTSHHCIARRQIDLVRGGRVGDAQLPSRDVDQRWWWEAGPWGGGHRNVGGHAFATMGGGCWLSRSRRAWLRTLPLPQQQAAHGGGRRAVALFRFGPARPLGPRTNRSRRC